MEIWDGGRFSLILRRRVQNAELYAALCGRDRGSFGVWEWDELFCLAGFRGMESGNCKLTPGGSGGFGVMSGRV